MNRNRKSPARLSPRISLDESDATKISSRSAGTYVPEPALSRAVRTRTKCPKCGGLLFDTEETRMRDDGMQVRRIVCSCRYRSWRLA